MPTPTLGAADIAFTDANVEELDAKQERVNHREQRTWLGNNQSQSTPDPTPADPAAAMMRRDSSMFLSSNEETDEALLRHSQRARHAGASNVSVSARLGGATPSAPGSGESLLVRHLSEYCASKRAENADRP